MSPQEWFWELESRTKEAPKGTTGTGTGGFSDEAWAEARKVHKAKMEAKNR